MANETLNALLKEYEQKKVKEEISADERKEELYKKIPRLQKLEDEMHTYALSTTKAILNKQNVSLLSLSDKIDTLKKEKEEILKKNNISLDYLKPQYECSLCKDTGYIQTDNYHTEMCSCLKQRLLDISFNRSNMSNLDKENFSTFNELLFSDEVNPSKYRFPISPRENIKNIKEKAYEFVQNFDNPDYKNLLFSGNTGLRKNFSFKLYCKRSIKNGENCIISNSPCFIRKYH